MSTGRIEDLVSPEALKQLDDLYSKLGISTQQMASAIEQAGKFRSALEGATTLEGFDKLNQSLVQTTQSAAAASVAINKSQKEIIVQTQALTDVVKIKVLADANADQVLKQTAGTLDQNIKLLIQQKLQLKSVNDELKNLNGQYAGTKQSQQALITKTTELTNEQLHLKDAIAQQTLVIKQQVKDSNAASGSQDQMLSKLNQLRKAYNSLSEEERNNMQVGGVLLGQIKQLATATSTINAEQGKYNDNVGNYTNNIKNAIAQYIPYGNQILRAIDGVKAISGLIRTMTADTAAQTAATAVATEGDIAATAAETGLAGATTTRAEGTTAATVATTALSTATATEGGVATGAAVGEGELTGTLTARTAATSGATEATVGATAAEGGLAAGATVLGAAIAAVAVVIAGFIYYISQLPSVGLKGQQVFSGLKASVSTFFDSILKGDTKDLADRMGGAYDQAANLTKGMQALDRASNVAEVAIKKLDGQISKGMQDLRNRNISEKDALDLSKQISDWDQQRVARKEMLAEKEIKMAINKATVGKRLSDDEERRIKQSLNNPNPVNAQAAAEDLERRDKIQKGTAEALKKGFLDNQDAVNEHNLLESKERNKMTIIQDRFGKKKLSDDKQANRELLENQKVSLSEAQKIQKLILDDENQTYDARISALKKYVELSKQIIDQEHKVADAAPGSNKVTRDTNARKANSQKTDVDHTAQSELAKINSQIAKDDQDLNKAKLTDAQKTQKLIFDDETKTQQERLGALAKYVEEANKLIDAEHELADKAPGMNAKRKATNAINAGTQKKDVELTNQSEKLKIGRQVIKGTVNNLEQDGSDQILAIRNNEAKKEEELTIAYAKGEINQKQYLAKLKQNNDKANTDEIDAQIETQKAILAIQQGNTDGSVTSGDIHATKNKITGLETQKTQGNIRTNKDTATGKETDSIKKAQDIGKAIDTVQQFQNIAEQALTAEYQRQIDLLEKKKQAIDDAATAEIDQVNNSIASEKTKQNEINIINKRAQIDKKQIDDQERKIKRQQAVSQKEANIASIIENTAVGVSMALAQGGFILGVPMAAVVGALGAVQLGVALAQPIQQFEKGGTVSQSGPIITGEAGPELRIDPTGKMSFTAPFANISYAQAGTKIISNKELMTMVGKPEPVMYVGAQQTDMKKVEELLKDIKDGQSNGRQRHSINVNVNTEWGTHKNNYVK